MKTKFLKPEFVEFMPPSLEEGVIYVSMEYGTAIHSCCCGCGEKVVTPLSPTDWKLMFDGENVSLHPSIGNWSFSCQSHYWIKNGSIKWSGKFTKEEIDEVRKRDKYAKSQHYKVADMQENHRPNSNAQPEKIDQNLIITLFRKISRFFQ